MLRTLVCSEDQRKCSIDLAGWSIFSAALRSKNGNGNGGETGTEGEGWTLFPFLTVARWERPAWVERSPALCRALCGLTLPCFFLWIRFLLCGAFLFSRLILPWFSCLFRHTIKFKVSELFTHGCRVFLPVGSCCPFRSRCTARIEGNKDMPANRVYLFR
jgi:hypothetical protein